MKSILLKCSVLGLALVLTSCAGGPSRKTAGRIADKSVETKAALSSYPIKTTPAQTDTFIISDSEASNATKRVTMASVVEGLDTVDLSATAPINLNSETGAISLVSSGLSAGQTWAWSGSAFTAQAVGGSSSVTVQSADPTSASAVGWYAATTSGDIFYKSSAGLFTIAGSYTADASDGTPAAFSFTDVTDATISTAYTDIKQITGIDIGITCSGSGGTVAACTGSTEGTCGSFGSTSGTITNNQYVGARVTSSGSTSTAVNNAVTCGGVSDTFTVTTAAPASVTLGIDSTANSYTSGFTGAGEIRLFRVQATASGTVSTFNFYQVSMHNWIGVIYSDNAGEPDTLLASTSSNTGESWGSFTWDTAALDAPESITNGDWYWEGVQVSSSADMQYKSRQSGTAKSYTTTFGSIPATWPTASDSDVNASDAGGVMYAN